MEKQVQEYTLIVGENTWNNLKAESPRKLVEQRYPQMTIHNSFVSIHVDGFEVFDRDEFFYAVVYSAGYRSN